MIINVLLLNDTTSILLKKYDMINGGKCYYAMIEEGGEQLKKCSLLSDVWLWLKRYVLKRSQLWWYDDNKKTCWMIYQYKKWLWRKKKLTLLYDSLKMMKRDENYYEERYAWYIENAINEEANYLLYMILKYMKMTD